MCSINGVGERLRKVLGHIDLGTLDSGERSLPFGLLVFLMPFLAYFNSNSILTSNRTYMYMSTMVVSVDI